ncbi:MAG: hypothetical protein U5L45_05635 [Saprospiraceae bacterium]|nr:hypothetical protein [Saprospiraceae bacterium]
MVHFSAKLKNEPPLLLPLREQNARKHNIYLKSSKRYKIDLKFYFNSLKALLFASLENRAHEIYRGERVLREKSSIFLNQKHTRP